MHEQPIWIFGYGSLVFRPAFPFVERRRAHLAGWTRRFWQGSPDHRGTAESPGLVATLVREEGAWCGGVAFLVAPSDADAVLEALDVREQAGFERWSLPLVDTPGQAAFAEGLVYVAGADNPHFLGPLDEAAIAAHVRRSRGPSGTNVEYVLRLADALRALEIHDPHVTAVAKLLA